MISKISSLYLSDDVYLTSQTSSSYELSQFSNKISRQLSSKLDLHTGGSISGDVDIVDANLSINTFENIYDVDDGQSLAEKLNVKQDKILSIDTLTIGVYASQHVYSGIYLSTGNGTNPKHLDYPSITADAVIATTTDISSQLSSYLDKCCGGEVSGDVSIQNASLSVLSGNYIQTSTPDAVINYASKNALIQADIDPHYGDSYVGTKAFCVLGLSSSVNQIKLSGDIQVLKDIVDGRLSVGNMPVDISKSRSLRNVFGKDPFKEGDLVTNSTNMSAAMFSLTLDSLAASMAFHLSAVDISTGIVTLNESLKNTDGFNALDNKSQSFFEDLWFNDDNAFYLVGFPELGNANVPNNFGQFVSGGSIRAIGRQTHAEGRDNIADVRYAHVEGSHCAAAHMATHAEGFRTIASKRYSHSEGEITNADGRAAHAEGKFTLASGDFSHVEGLSAIASAAAAHAEGRLTEASGLNSHAEGKSTIASGEQSHALGLQTKSKGKNTFTAGYMSEASKYADNAFVIGRYSMADADNGSNSFVWQGISSGTAYYCSNSKGSFNINPQNGLSGFYIGQDNFIQCVLSAVQSMDETQKAALKTTLGL